VQVDITAGTSLSSFCSQWCNTVHFTTKKRVRRWRVCVSLLPRIMEWITQHSSNCGRLPTRLPSKKKLFIQLFSPLGRHLLVSRWPLKSLLHATFRRQNGRLSSDYGRKGGFWAALKESQLGGEGQECTIIQLAKDLSRQKLSLSWQGKSKKGLELDSLKPSSTL